MYPVIASWLAVGVAMGSALVMLDEPFIYDANEDIHVRIADAGQGLCTMTVAPGGSVMIYDAGSQRHGVCLEQVQSFMRLHNANKIELMILSHLDEDHIKDAAPILDEFDVDKLIWTGATESRTNVVRRTARAIERTKSKGTLVIDLEDGDVIDPEFKIGEAIATVVAGWHEWTRTDLSDSEARNAISIVVRMEYKGNAVLFTGDTIGRRLSDTDNECKDAEAYMVANQNDRTIKAQVLLAGHHGANNASASCFIQAVDPTYVVFASGRGY